MRHSKKHALVARQKALSDRIDFLEALVLELRNRANKHGWFPEAENPSAPPAVAVQEEQ